MAAAARRRKAVEILDEPYRPECARRTLAVRVDEIVSISNVDRCRPKPYRRSMDGRVQCPPIHEYAARDTKESTNDRCV
jgi:hypothetical protein